MIRTILTIGMAALTAVCQAQNSGPAHPQSAPRPGQAKPAQGGAVPAATQKTVETQSKNAEPGSAVPPNQPIITIHGLCSGGQGSDSGCSTVVTRSQFDSLLSAV